MDGIFPRWNSPTVGENHLHHLDVTFRAIGLRSTLRTLTIGVAIGTEIGTIIKIYYRLRLRSFAIRLAKRPRAPWAARA